MKEIIEQIDSLLNIAPQGPSLPVPPPLLLNTFNRAGLSPTRLTQRVLEREAEIYAYDDPHRRFITILCEELVREIQENCIVEVAIPPATAVVSATGANGAGAVQSIGTVTNIMSGQGIMR